MKQLLLIRHAKSSWSDPRLSDYDRPLNKRGKRDAPCMGKRLASASVRIDCMVSSGAKRARKTARVIAGEIGYPKEDIIIREEIYSAHLLSLLSVIESTNDSISTLGLVGHNHVITECAEWLTGESLVNIPTCGIVAVGFDVQSWKHIDRLSGRLQFFDYPRLHGNECCRE